MKLMNCMYTLHAIVDLSSKTKITTFEHQRWLKTNCQQNPRSKCITDHNAIELRPNVMPINILFSKVKTVLV